MGAVTPAVAAEAAARRAPLRPAHVLPASALALLAAAATLMRLEPSAWTVLAAGGAATLAWVAAIDLETRLLPDRIVLPAAALLVVLGAAVDPDHAAERLIAAVCAFAFLLVAVVLKPDSLGMGDAKLALLLGALLGRGVLAALIVGFSAVGIAGLLLVVRRGRGALKLQLPLGPFLAVGAVAVLLLHG